MSVAAGLGREGRAPLLDAVDEVFVGDGARMLLVELTKDVMAGIAVADARDGLGKLRARS